MLSFPNLHDSLEIPDRFLIILEIEQTFYFQYKYIIYIALLNMYLKLIESRLF